MRTSRQDYRDSTLAEALKSNCDTLQLKYDGWWSRIEITYGQGRVFSETNRLLEKFNFQLPEPSTLVLVGELMYGTQWAKDPSRYGKIYLFDIWQYEDSPLEDIPYKERYALLRIVRQHLSPQFELVPNFKIGDRDAVWKQFVESEQFEGVVYRNSKATVGAPVLREKLIITEDLKVVGFRAGLGKHAGRLGALLCTSATGVPTDVGGGLDDQTRIEVWNAQDRFLGRWCQVEARKRFESGSLRHPNFIAWRPEGWEP